MQSRRVPTGISCLLALLVFSTLFASPLPSQQVIATVPAGRYLGGVAVNPVTNKIYAVSSGDYTVTVIDGSTLSTQTVSVAAGPTTVAVDEMTNKIYVGGAGPVSVIDGATNQVTQVYTSSSTGLALNKVTNKIYVSDPEFGFLYVIDGQTLATQVIETQTVLSPPAVNERTNKIYFTTLDGELQILDGATNTLTSMSFNFGRVSGTPAVNPNTNQIFIGGSYQQNQYVVVVDGRTLSSQVLSVPNFSSSSTSIVVDTFTNKAYIASQSSIDNGSSSVILVDGTTLAVTTINVPEGIVRSLPGAAVEPITNRAYVATQTTSGSYAVLVVHASGPDVAEVLVPSLSGSAGAIAVDSTTNRIYVANEDNAISVIAGPTPLRFVPLTPCRVVDTRQPNGPLGGPPIQGGTERDFPLPQGQCGIPASASAYSLNATVVPHQHLGYLTVWPTGETQPNVSTMNSVDGRVKANAAIVPAGLGGSVSVYASDTTDVILDINGYFASANAMALAYYPLNSCRVVDTRGPNGPYLTGGQERDFSILGVCDIPSRAQAYALNVTALPHHHLGYLTVWPEGQQQPLVSTLNAPTGATTANAALVTAGTDGEIAVYPSDDTDLLIDVNGYFAPLGPGGMSLYTVLPCRALDTRQGRGAFSGITLVDMVDSGCNVNEAEAYVLNATVVPRGPLGYLTIWPTTEFMPPTSTLNAADGVVTSNLAIVPNIDGWLDVFASNPTNLIIDAFGYFAP